MAEPIYIETLYIQRKKIVGRPQTAGQDLPPSEWGYKLIPGKVIDLWLYNTAAERYQPAGTFFEPVEFMDVRGASFVAGVTGATTNPNDVYDNFRLQFTDNHYVPFVRHDEDMGVCSGFFDGNPGRLLLASG